MAQAQEVLLIAILRNPSEAMVNFDTMSSILIIMESNEGLSGGGN